MVRHGVVAAVAAFALLAATPSASFDPVQLAVGTKAPIAVHSRPLVIVAFASWCVGCLDEMPRVIQDYARFKDRADFLGVDYLDNPSAGDAVVAKYHIPFPVVQSHPNTDAPPPVDPNASVPEDSIHLAGVPPKALLQLLPQMAKSGIDPATIAKLKDIGTYCASASASACTAYATARGVSFTAPVLAPVNVANMPAATVTLPHLYVVDSSDIVRADVSGYNSGEDPIVIELAKLGIK
ncbi:MAG TPA: hypothetical protein VMW12_06275 [Candidatus Dormibacteraeota bacterium]|nr:hypothetical protein [Candidatus Dormibacteraeota bacterium]